MLNFISKKLVKSILWIALILALAIPLSITLKGELGNPTAKYIQSHLKEGAMPFENAPERNRYAQLISIADYGTTTLPKEVAKTVLPDLGYHNGKFVGLYPPGFLALALPLYLLGKAFGVAQLATFSVTVIFTLASFLLIKNVSNKLGINSIASSTAGVLFLFGTSAWAYTTTIYQHSITSFILLLMYRLILAKRSIFSSGFIWALGFFAFLLDSPNVFFVAPILIYLLFENSSIDVLSKKIKIRISKNVLLGTLFIVPIFSAWVFYNLNTYSMPIKLSQAVTSIRKFDKYDRPILPKNNEENDVTSFLQYNDFARGSSVLTISNDRGIILYSPYILLSLFGVSKLLKSKRKEISLLLSMIVAIITVYSAWGDPWGGWAFGPRYLIPSLALSTIFLGQAIQTYRRNWLFLGTLVVSGLYSIGINALGAITTNQVPPYHEATGLHMKHNFLLNWDYLVGNRTGSFVYNTFLKGIVSLPIFYFLLVANVWVLFISFLTVTVFKRSK